MSKETTPTPETDALERDAFEAGYAPTYTGFDEMTSLARDLEIRLAAANETIARLTAALADLRSAPAPVPEGVRARDREAAAKAIQPFFTEGKIYAIDLEYWAWPQTFGSTVGPFGGAGGASMTVFTIEAYAFGSLAAIMCQGKVLRVTDDFRPCGDYTKMPRAALPTPPMKEGE